MEDSKQSKKYGRKNDLHRLVGVDFARGFGLLVIIVTHLYNYWGLPNVPSANAAGGNKGGSGLLNLILLPFIIMGSWASAFAAITGLSVAYTMHYQISKGGISLKKRALQSLVNALIILIINYVYIYFFIYPTTNITELVHQGLIPASIRYGELRAPPFEFLFIASPLTMVAFSNIVVNVTCTIMWRKGAKQENIRKQQLFLVILGILIIYIAEPVKNWLIPILYEQHDQKNYAVSMLLTWLVGTKHCIFPFLGYAFVGAYYGLYFRRDYVDFKKVRNQAIYLSLVFFIPPVILGLVRGFPSIDDLIGLYHPPFLYLINAGLEILFMTLSIWYLDRIPPEQRKDHRRFRMVVIFQRLSLISLTVFLMEEPMAGIYTKITKLILPGLLESHVFLIFWTACYTFIWIYAVNKWDKKGNFKYTFEWAIKCARSGINIKSNGDILNLQKHIYEALGFESKEEYYELKRQRKLDKKLAKEEE